MIYVPKVQILLVVHILLWRHCNKMKKSDYLWKISLSLHHYQVMSMRNLLDIKGNPVRIRNSPATVWFEKADKSVATVIRKREGMPVGPSQETCLIC